MAEHNRDGMNVTMFLKDQQSVVKNFYNTRNFDPPDFMCDDFVPQSISKEQHDMKEDIHILDQIYENITNYETNKINLKDTLITIGSLAGDISYNDLRDKESYYIRNRYGYIRRNKNKSINKNGVYFENISHLKTILSDDHNYLSIPELEIDNLKIHLSHLKQKIAYILSKHNSSIYYQNLKSDLNIDFSVSITDITKFSKTYYEQLILKRVNTELEHLESIDFKIKEDRYYFTRVFCILGELFNNWLEERSQVQNTVLMTTFRKINKMRNLIVHNFTKVKFGMEKENQTISQLINKVINHLKVVIEKKENLNGRFEINYLYVDIDMFHDAMHQLLSCFTEKSAKIKSGKKNTTEVKMQNKIKSNKNETNKNRTRKLNRLLSSASDEIEVSSTVLKSQSKIDSNINVVENQQNLVNLDDSKSTCQSASNLSNKDTMKGSCENIIPMSSNLSSDSSVKLINKFDSTIHAIKEEIDYLTSLHTYWSNCETEKHPMKHKYVIQQIMLRIGQLVRDIENIGICKQSTSGNLDVDSLPIFSSLKRFSSSFLISEGKIKSKQLRNSGLAHNIFSFNDEDFSESLKEMICLSSQFDTFYTIFTRDKLPPIMSQMFLVGSCFFRVYMFKEAIEYFEKALDVSVGHYCDVVAEFDPEFISVFRINYNTLQIYIYLIEACFKGSYFEKALDKCEFIWKKIDMTKISRISQETLLYVYRINMRMFDLLDRGGRSTKALKILENLDSVNADCNLKLWILDHYMKTYNFSKSLKIIKSFTDPPSIFKDHFMVKTAQIQCLLDQYDKSKKPEIENCIVELEDILGKHIINLKISVGDNYVINLITILFLKLNLICESIYTNDVDGEMNKLQAISIQFKDMCKYADNSYDEEIISEFRKVSILFHEAFLLAYHYHICASMNREIMKEAQFYLCFAEKFIEKNSTSAEMRKIVEDHANEFSNHFTKFVFADRSLSAEERIEYLLEIINLHEKWNFDKTHVSIKLAESYKGMARGFFDSWKQSDNSEFEQYTDKELASINKAIKYYYLALECIRKENNVPSRSTSTNIYEIKVSLAECYYTKISIQYTSKSMVECLLYCNELLILPLPGNNRKRVLDIRCSCRNTLVRNNLVLTLSSAPNSSFRFTFRGDMSLENEIKHSSDEFIGLAQFYKVLQFNHLIKVD